MSPDAGARALRGAVSIAGAAESRLGEVGPGWIRGSWPPSLRDTARVADAETALSFHRLLSVIRKSEAFQSLPRPELSLLAGAVITRRLGALVEPRPSTHSAN